ncbi:hypothetical protein NBRC10512_000264 [Rhodotorula toruloides]|uniref:RHTO0S04e12222g1_1 n=2 Tax=Rhodotorula toruloides TaxID=5286 RepID=A0A061AQT8_RHOTO|nr:uncharacterized protein RHTO_05965 [Rhodotorula toruloides NP11]EMS18434.1 hypothetical protein RHTO_05965 [Rhodotorula toruloides NP11]CDR39933.1 RHTO0S04e12222g1_1 [Rhodotorula toruloides]
MPDSRRPSNASSSDSSSTISSLGLLISDDDLLALANDDVDFWMSLHMSEYPVADPTSSLPLNNPLFRLLRDPPSHAARPAKNTDSPVWIPLPRLLKLEFRRNTVAESSHSPGLVSPLFLPPTLPGSLPSLVSSSPPTSSSSVRQAASPSHSNDTPPDSFSPGEPSPRKLPFAPLDSPRLSYDLDLDLHLLAGVVAQENRLRRVGGRRRTHDVDAVSKDAGMGRVECWVEDQRGRRVKVA